MGGVNATVIVSTLPLAVIWLYTRAPGPRRRALTGWWMVSVVLACFWWAVPTVLQGKYGYNYLPYTETSSVTTGPGSVFAALRGTSNWQNYDDLGGPLVPGGWTLVTSWVAIVATSLVAALGLAGLARRIPERLFLVAGFCFGVVVIAIGYRGALGGPFSSHVITLLSGGLGPLRNVSKFSPDVALPLALGLTWLVSTISVDGITARWAQSLRLRRLRVLTGLIAVVAVAIAAVPFWQQNLYPPGGFTAIPHYWTQAANWLDGHQGHQAAMLVPGADFADYTWGKPQDEPLSVLTSTSVTARSIIPLGSNGNTDMLSAVEAALSTGSPQPGLAPFLARSGIDYVVERNDLNLRATGAPPPAQIHQVLSETPGLVEVAGFGPYLPRSQVAPGDLQLYDSATYLRLRPVEIYKVDGAVSEVRTFPVSNPVIVSGSSGSLLPIAATGELAGRAAVLAKDPHAAGAASSVGATWAITDGNQRRAVSFGLIDDNLSYLLGPDQGPFSSIPLTYGSLGASDAQTVAAPIGALSVLSSTFGSTPLILEPSEGPTSAFDGNPATAWVAADVDKSVGQWVSITFDRAVPLTSIVITPLDDSPARPSIEWATITTDRGSVTRYIPVRNTPVSVNVVPGSTQHLMITIAGVRPATKASIPRLGAGIRDVSIPGVTFRPAMQLPSDESAAFSAATRNPPILSVNDPVTNPDLAFSGPTTSVEPFARRFLLPKAMSATISGTAVPNPGAPLEQLLSQVATPARQSVQISASSWLRSLPRFRPENLLETSSSPWVAGLNDRDPSLTLHWKGIRSVGSISLGLSSQASRPTHVVITSPTQIRRVSIPREGGIVSFAPVATDTLTIQFVGVAKRVSAIPTGARSAFLPVRHKVALPVGLSSVGIPALGHQVNTSPALSTAVTLPCGTGPSVQVDNASLPTVVTGTLGNLINLQPMNMRICTSGETHLTAGSHILAFPSGSPFRVTGLLVQQPPAGVRTASDIVRRSVRVLSWTPSKRTFEVGAGPANYVQVAQNFNPGWVATLDGQTLKPVSLDGWEQGWVVPAGTSGTMTMTFTPDHSYRAGLAIGGIFLVGLFILALGDRRRSVGDPIGPRRKLPGVVLAAVAAVVVLCVGGWLFLLLVPLVVVTKKWGSSVIAAIGGAAFATAGIIVALHPNPTLALTARAVGAPAEICSVVALCAVLCAVVVEERRRPADQAPSPEADVSPGFETP